MGSTRSVIVCGGGANLYKISEYGGWFHVHHVEIGLLSDLKRSIGRTRSLEDSIDLIKSHSGRDIQHIE